MKFCLIMFIGLFVASIVLMAAYVVASILLFNNKEKEKYNLANHFPYELHESNKIVSFRVLPFLFLSIALVVTLYILHALHHFHILSVVKAIVGLVSGFSIGVLFLVPLNKFKERCTFSIVLIALTAMMNALLVYEEIYYLTAYGNEPLIYVAIVINALIALGAMVAILSPKLFDFTNERNSDGLLVRKRIIPLALYEWILIFAYPITAISIVFLNHLLN